jgi:hypothetical protein
VMSNSLDELPQSSLQSLSKYSHHLFLIFFFGMESLCHILNAFYLDDVPRLPLLAFGHPIDVLLPFLCTQPLVWSMIHLTPCFTHRPLCGVLYHFLLLYVIHTPIQVHMLKSLFLLLNSLVHLLIPPPCLFSFTFAPFGHSESF